MFAILYQYRNIYIKILRLSLAEINHPGKNKQIHFFVFIFFVFICEALVLYVAATFLLFIADIFWWSLQNYKLWQERQIFITVSEVWSVQDRLCCPFCHLNIVFFLWVWLSILGRAMSGFSVSMKWWSHGVTKGLSIRYYGTLHCSTKRKEFFEVEVLSYQNI